MKRLNQRFAFSPMNWILYFLLIFLFNAATAENNRNTRMNTRVQPLRGGKKPMKSGPVWYGLTELMTRQIHNFFKC